MPSESVTAPKANPDCPRCDGLGWEYVQTDDRSGMRRCECLKSNIRRFKLNSIPPLYRFASLVTAQPDLKRHPAQAEILAEMQANPTASYVLCGENDCGKTMMGWMLYRAAVERDVPAVGITCSELVSQFREWQFDANKMPVIEPDDLRSEQRRFLFIDELDKARPTEFVGEMLFSLIDAAYSYQHQLVVASNLTLENLSSHWSRHSVSVGPSIVRRLMQVDGCVLVGMFQEEAA